MVDHGMNEKEAWNSIQATAFSGHLDLEQWAWHHRGMLSAVVWLVFMAAADI